ILEIKGLGDHTGQARALDRALIEGPGSHDRDGRWEGALLKEARGGQRVVEGLLKEVSEDESKGRLVYARKRLGLARGKGEGVALLVEYVLEDVTQVEVILSDEQRGALGWQRLVLHVAGSS